MSDFDAPTLKIDTPAGEVEITVHNDRQMYVRADKGFTIYGVNYTAGLHVSKDEEGKWNVTIGDRIHLSRTPWTVKEPSSAARLKATSILLVAAAEVAVKNPEVLRRAKVNDLWKAARRLESAIETQEETLAKTRKELADVEAQIKIAEEAK